ncbi:hypothetical protein PMAYCL1PPCAC_10798, partial [Pristionchus mayeri]
LKALQIFFMLFWLRVNLLNSTRKFYKSISSKYPYIIQRKIIICIFLQCVCYYNIYRYDNESVYDIAMELDQAYYRIAEVENLPIREVEIENQAQLNAIRANYEEDVQAEVIRREAAERDRNEMEKKYRKLLIQVGRGQDASPPK